MDYLKKYLPYLAALTAFAIYMLTIAPGVIQIDAGELASVQHTMGIAHPTGYPLFTIIGYILLKIPLPFTVIFKANFLASVWCALAVFLFVKSAELLLSLSSMNQLPERASKKYKILNQSIPFAKDIIPIASACAGIFVAFNKTFWEQSVAVEVYSLQVFLFTLIIYTSLKAYQSDSIPKTGWMWVAVTFALGFSNHMTTLLAIPFTVILFFNKEKFSRNAFIKIGYMALAFFPLLILFYSYLPLRASYNPAINWSNPTNFENFYRHITGRQYSVWLFTSLEAAKKHLGDYIANFPEDFSYLGAIIGLIGIFYIFKTSKIMFSAALFTFLFGVFYSINYDIVDLASYFLLSNIMFGFFIAFGFIKIINFIKETINNKFSAPLIIFLSCTIPVLVNFSDVNQSGIYTFEDYTKAIMNSSEKHSIIFSYQWDYFISPSYYFQHCEQFRTDLAIIDKELLRRSWYYSQLKNNHPEILKNMEQEIRNFLISVQPFEQNQDFDSELLEKNYRALLTKLISGNADRNFYFGLELYQTEIKNGQFSIPDGYQIVPNHLMFQVVKGNSYVPAPEPDFKIRFPEKKNHYVQFIETSAATMLTYRAIYELQFGYKDKAQVYLKKIMNEFKGYQIPADVLSKAEMTY